MSSLKRFFITPYLMYLMAATAYAVSGLINDSTALTAQLGLLLAAAVPMAFFMWLMFLKPARTSAHLLPFTLLSGAGVAIVMVVDYRSGGAVSTAFILAAIAFIGWYLYLRWYSRLPQPDLPHLAEGKILPEFQLQNANGETVSSTEFRGSPHILLFYRGNWCPLCMAQIQEVAGQWREIEQRGAKVVLVSPQSQKHTLTLAQRFDVPMQFLHDPSSKAALKLNIAAPGSLPLGMEVMGYDSNAVLPTVIISDSEGRILYAHLTDNYRVRPEPETFISVLDGHKPATALT